MKMCSTGFVKTNVCVVGGGFGGLYTALKLAKQKDMKNSNIYLFDSKDKFVFLPLLYELAVGSASILEACTIDPKVFTLL
jgi:NADH:ubiquinone reductase (non-electrogenic)